jgi:hypothetical protein
LPVVGGGLLEIDLEGGVDPQGADLGRGHPERQRVPSLVEASGDGRERLAVDRGAECDLARAVQLQHRHDLDGLARPGALRRQQRRQARVGLRGDVQDVDRDVGHGAQHVAARRDPVAHQQHTVGPVGRGDLQGSGQVGLAPVEQGRDLGPDVGHRDHVGREQPHFRRCAPGVVRHRRGRLAGVLSDAVGDIDQDHDGLAGSRQLWLREGHDQERQHDAPQPAEAAARQQRQQQQEQQRQRCCERRGQPIHGFKATRPGWHRGEPCDAAGLARGAAMPTGTLRDALGWLL